MNDYCEVHISDTIPRGVGGFELLMALIFWLTKRFLRGWLTALLIINLLLPFELRDVQDCGIL